MKTRHRAVGLIFLLLFIGLSACNASFGSFQGSKEVVDRTKPPLSFEHRTATLEWIQTATSDHIFLQTKQAEQSQATAQAESTANAEAFALQTTAIAQARESLILAYQYYENFDQNTFNWRTGIEDYQAGKGELSIQNGRYIWQISSVISPFITWSDFSTETDLEDFDVALKARRQEGEASELCYGFLFRTSPSGLNGGTYVLSVCDSSFYKLVYFDDQSGTDIIQDWTYSELINKDWNLIEINARGSDFTIFINHQWVTSFSDSRLPSGTVSIAVNISGLTPGQIEVEFFALQPR
jgi:hypothetical protein